MSTGLPTLDGREVVGSSAAASAAAPVSQRLDLLDSLARSADRARRLVWSLFGRLGIGRQLIANRDARLATLASFHMVLALTLSATLPAWMLLVGPIILGVPHVVADVRYLLIRPLTPISRAARLGIVLPLALLIVLRLVNVVGGPESLRLEVGCGVAALLFGVVLARGRRAVQATLVTVATLLGGAALLEPRWATLAMAHLHNFVAVGLFVTWSKRQGFSRHALLVGATFMVCVMLLASGLLEPLSHLGASLNPASGIDLDLLAEALAPGLPQTLAMRVLLIYAFAQAVHYTIWLRLIPGSEPFEAQRAPTTFRRNARRLRADFGRLGVLAVIGISLFVPIAGCVNALATRDVYFSIVVFHGWLELAVLAHLLAGRR